MTPATVPPAYGRLAQLGERFPYKEEVGGSSPSTPTIDQLWRAAVPGKQAGRRFQLEQLDSVPVQQARALSPRSSISSGV